MDIFNRPPAISEDTLHYTLYPSSELSDRASLTTFATCIHDFVESLTYGLIWHRDAFELKVVSDSNKDGWMMEGIMRVGDCVDDEWCVVWLLREISKKWDMIISVFDSDGEFLLIEAADGLPSWVKPTNTENRVWIYQAHLHLVPLFHSSPPSSKARRRRLPGIQSSDDEADSGQDDNDWIAIVDALRLVRDSDVDTIAPEAVQSLVWKRVSKYPTTIRNHVHKTKVYVPIDIARALTINPSLVQKPIETFYTRDAIQLRSAHKMSRFPPESSVLTTIKMTRTAYAQLVGQRFHPPKIFGHWQEKEGTVGWRWRDIGMKIACGFEMLYQESKSRVDFTTDGVYDTSAAQVRMEALRRNKEYIKYTANLVYAGYFKGETEGSQQWNILEEKAASTFTEVRREDDAARPTFSTLLNAALHRASATSVEEPEDSDDWLNIDAQDFDDMLKKTMGSNIKDNQLNSMNIDSTTQGAESDKMASDQAARLKDFAQKVEDFVEKEGDIEGVKFEDEQSSEDEFSDEMMSDSDDDNEGKENEVERQAAIDKLVPGLEPAEYGQMPASFYSNSQRVAPTMETGLEDNEAEDKSHDVTPLKESLLRPIRQPIIPRDKYDGVDSDDASDDENEPEQDDESEEEQPQVLGEIEVDMGEEEEEFLEFSRQALGISNEHWGEILRERKGRGAFVPLSAEKIATLAPEPVEPAAAPLKPSPEQSPESGPRSNVNPNLDSFEAVMKAMDDELAHTRKSKTNAEPHKQGKGKTPVVAPEDNEDIESAMDAELRAMLEKAGGEDDEEDDEEPMDYNLIKNFLESFKSQAGLSGPVSNLAGRLQPEWQLPRDEA